VLANLSINEKTIKTLFQSFFRQIPVLCLDHEILAALVVKTGLADARFETIHPFIDGNE
jgi:hypothetical protein